MVLLLASLIAVSGPPEAGDKHAMQRMSLDDQRMEPKLTRIFSLVLPLAEGG